MPWCVAFWVVCLEEKVKDSSDIHFKMSAPFSIKNKSRFCILTDPGNKFANLCNVEKIKKIEPLETKMDGSKIAEA